MIYLDIYLSVYLKEKYILGQKGGVIGKIFNDTFSQRIKKNNSGIWKCQICDIVFCSLNGLSKHRRKQSCIRNNIEGEQEKEITFRLNKQHAQAYRLDELVWGD